MNNKTILKDLFKKQDEEHLKKVLDKYIDSIANYGFPYMAYTERFYAELFNQQFNESSEKILKIKNNKKREKESYKLIYNTNDSINHYKKLISIAEDCINSFSIKKKREITEKMINAKLGWLNLQENIKEKTKW